MDSPTPQNFEQETRSRGTSESGDGEGLSSVGVRAVATVPPLLQPFLAEVLKSHHRKVFMGEPSDFPGWKHAWESFLEACRATSRGMALPDIAVLHLMEGWLDKGSQILLHTRMSEKPDLRYSEFFAELCREFEFDSGRGKRNRWRDVHLKLPRGKVTFAEWRNFKLSLEATLAGVEHPLEEDLREHLIRQLPQGLKEEMVRESMHQGKNKNLVSVHFPPSIPRAEVLEKVGVELGLRLRDDPPHGENLIVDCLTESNQKRALALDGFLMVNPLGRPSGMLSVRLVRSAPLTSKEIFDLVDAHVWGALQLQQMAGNDEDKTPTQSKIQVQAVENRSGRGGSPQKVWSPKGSPRTQYRASSPREQLCGWTTRKASLSGISILAEGAQVADGRKSKKFSRRPKKPSR